MPWFYDGQLNVLTWDNAEVDVDIHAQIKTPSIPCLDNAMTVCPENTVMHSGAGGRQIVLKTLIVSDQREKVVIHFKWDELMMPFNFF